MARHRSRHKRQYVCLDSDLSITVLSKNRVSIVLATFTIALKKRLADRRGAGRYFFISLKNGYSITSSSCAQ